MIKLENIIKLCEISKDLSVIYHKFKTKQYTKTKEENRRAKMRNDENYKINRLYTFFIFKNNLDRTDALFELFKKCYFLNKDADDKTYYIDVQTLSIKHKYNSSLDKRIVKDKNYPAFADRKSISNIYNLCKLLNKFSSKVKYHVDHIIALKAVNEQNEHVCSGLHVANNLRIITDKENLKKRNLFIERLIC